MARLGRAFVVASVALAGIGSGGCTALEDGVRAGLEDGLSAALAAIIETPITFALEQLFSQPAGGG